jgi:hypothetical protein
MKAAKLKDHIYQWLSFLFKKWVEEKEVLAIYLE